MVRRFFIGLSLVTLLFAQHAEAAHEASIVSSVTVTKTTPHALAGSSPQKKEVFLMPVHLTAEQMQKLLLDKAKAPTVARRSLMKNINLPSSFDLGMNGVPMLDQGRHGACATFAVTGAIDALIGKGDYISQLCNLELGEYLEKRGYFPSGWNGSDGQIILNQIEQFGIITKENQRTKSCSGMKEYPLKEAANTGTPMALDDFKAMSENLSDFNGSHFLYWEPMLTLMQRFEWDENNVDAEKTLQQVKQTLVKKQQAAETRLVVGVLVAVNHCDAGACGTYHAKNDTWALTKAIKNDPKPNIAGHAMIITGYQDDAVVTDHEGDKHQGVLILRNSWGDEVGDKGTYYITYDYFKTFVIDIERISRFKIKNNNQQ